MRTNLLPILHEQLAGAGACAGESSLCTTNILSDFLGIFHQAFDICNEGRHPFSILLLLGDFGIACGKRKPPFQLLGRSYIQQLKREHLYFFWCSSQQSTLDCAAWTHVMPKFMELASHCSQSPQPFFLHTSRPFSREQT